MRAPNFLRSIVLFGCLSTLLACFSCFAQTPGLLDLSNHDFKTSEVYTLDAQWNIAWGNFYNPLEVPSGTSAFTFPSVWNNHLRPDGSSGPYGVATLYLDVEFPESLEGVYLKLSDLPSAGTLWANGVAIVTQGQIGHSFDSEQPGFGPDTVYIPLVSEATYTPLSDSPSKQSSNHVLFTLHLSNFHFKEGGAWHSIQVSGESGLNALATFPAVLDSSLTILLLVLGGLFLSLYMARRQEMAALFFGCFCLAVGIRNGVTGEHILNHWLPFISWTLSQRLEHILMFISAPLFIAFAHQLYPQYRSKQAERIFTAIALLFSAFTLFTPSTWFTQSSLPYQVIILICLLYLFRIAVLAVRHKRNSSVTFLLSFIVLSVLVFLDVLTHNMILQLPLMTEWGVTSFVIMQAWLLNQRYAFSLNNEEALSQRLQQKNTELKKLDAMKDDFLAQTSHELRTPIHGISSLTELVLNQEKQLDQESTTNLKLIHSSSVRLSNLVNDILDLSSIKHNQLKLHIVAVNLSAVLDQVTQSLRPLLKGRPVSLQTHCPQWCPKVMADESRLQQILFNLIGNAIKFTPEGDISVTVEVRDKDRILISIKDTGLGFDVSESNELFEAFRQGTQPGMSASGHGLGLTITRDLLRMHNSELKVKSIPGHGSTFYFELETATHLPLSVQEITRKDLIKQTPTDSATDSSAHSLTDVPTNSSQVSERRHTDRSTHPKAPTNNTTRSQDYPLMVWAVDDEPINLQIIEHQITGFGYQFRGFSLGQHLLDALEKDEQPDLLLLDIMMPGINGLELCRLVRSSYSNLELPIIMLTARQQTKDIVDAFEAGASDYLAKPYNQAELRVRVDAQIKASLCHELSQNNEQLLTHLETTEALQEQLQHRNQLLLNVFDASSTPLLVLNEDLSLEYQNLAMTQLIRSNPGIFSNNQPTPLIDRIRNNLDKLIPNHRWLDTFAEINHQLMVHQFQHNKKTTYAVILEELSPPNHKTSINSPEIENTNIEKAGVEAIKTESLNTNDGIEDRVRLLEELVIQLANVSPQSLGSLNNPTLIRSMQINSTHTNQAPNHSTFGSSTSNDSASSDTKSNTPLHDTPSASETQYRQLLDSTFISTESNAINQAQQARHTLVDATRLALRLWQKHTNKTKTDLAEESGIWRIYIDGGTLKTRTLDKYLNEKTLPQKPRWRSVIKTLDYLVQNCTLDAKEKEQIETLITLIEEYHLSK